MKLLLLTITVLINVPLISSGGLKSIDICDHLNVTNCTQVQLRAAMLSPDFKHFTLLTSSDHLLFINQTFQVYNVLPVGQITCPDDHHLFYEAHVVQH